MENIGCISHCSNVYYTTVTCNDRNNENIKDIFLACMEKGFMPDIEEIYKKADTDGYGRVKICNT